MKFAVMSAAAVAAMSMGLARAAPLEAYGHLPTMDQVSISPDGAKVAFVQPVNGKQAVVIDQLNPVGVVLELSPSEQKVRQLRWADSTHLLVVKSVSGFVNGVTNYSPGVGSVAGEWSLLQSVDLTTRKSFPLFEKTKTRARRRGCAVL